MRSTKGEPCHRCADACPEGIDLHHPETSAPLNECTKCRACADACPMHAIALPFLPKRDVIPVEVVEDELANR
ncbi:4Fe-4S binding protein [Eggerthella sinensis]|uniref:4Fe-4S binding protein n=1 Tax=Eggerthella sinensis TaxID=242230 RepID=UPI003872E2A4